MKAVLAILIAGLLALPGSANQADQVAEEPYIEAMPLCKDGEIVGIYIRSNVPVDGALTWDRKICLGRST